MCVCVFFFLSSCFWTRTLFSSHLVCIIFLFVYFFSVWLLFLFSRLHVIMIWTFLAVHLDIIIYYIFGVVLDPRHSLEWFHSFWSNAYCDYSCICVCFFHILCGTAQSFVVWMNKLHMIIIIKYDQKNAQRIKQFDIKRIYDNFMDDRIFDEIIYLFECACMFSFF